MKAMGRALVERMKACFYLAAAIVGGIRLFLDPNRLSDVFVLDRAVTTPRALARIVRRARGAPGGAEAIAARRRLPMFTVSALGELPPGTLGRAVADFMGARGLDP